MVGPLGYYCSVIGHIWYKTTDALFQIGDILNEAKKVLPHGEIPNFDERPTRAVQEKNSANAHAHCS